MDKENEMKTIDISKTKARVLIVSVYTDGHHWEPGVDYQNHKVFKYAPKWATGFPTFISAGVLKDIDGYTRLGLGADKACHKIAYLWTN
jgi:hypothetical protein